MLGHKIALHKKTFCQSEHTRGPPFVSGAVAIVFIPLFIGVIFSLDVGQDEKVDLAHFPGDLGEVAPPVLKVDVGADFACHQFQLAPFENPFVKLIEILQGTCTEF